MNNKDRKGEQHNVVEIFAMLGKGRCRASHGSSGT
jgi:hypothetical protein